MELLLYHGTDKTYAEKILKNGFTIIPNKSHWLGNGVYFYLDYDLAKWWTGKPSQRFGAEITLPCVVSVELDVGNDSVLDLRKLEDYRKCLELFPEFRRYAYQEFDYKGKKFLRKLDHIIKNAEQKNICEIRSSFVKEGIFEQVEMLRCSFFDWVFRMYAVDCIIGNFVKTDQKYLADEPSEARNQLLVYDLPFVETQVCVRKEVANQGKRLIVTDKGAAAC